MLTVMSGRLLESRGALIPALDSGGLDQNECLRTREAIQEGSWWVKGLLKRLWEWVKGEGKWEALEVAGYKVKAVDSIGIYRPRLEGCVSKHYNSNADKALPAINFAVMSAIGRVGEQKVSLPEVIVRGEERGLGEEALIKKVCREAKSLFGKKDVGTADRKVSVLLMLEGGIKQVVVRRASNLTVRRRLVEGVAKEQGAKKKRGRPSKRGALIRPLERKRKGKLIPASTPDEVHHWYEETDRVEARLWRDVVLSEQKVWSEQAKLINQKQSWVVVVVIHPQYDEPMVILSNLQLPPQQTYAIMCGRFGVEQMPLVSKQLLGAHRMFVFAKEMCFRLPELAFVAGSTLMAVAAHCEEMPTGWWDTHPKPTAGRLRRQLRKVQDFHVLHRPDILRKKNSTTAHLPKGFHPAIKKHRNISET